MATIDNRTTTVEPVETVGVSPKVSWPTAALFSIGAVLLVLSIILKDDTLRDFGIAAIGASGVTVGAGFAAPTGLVKVLRSSLH